MKFFNALFVSCFLLSVFALSAGENLVKKQYFHSILEGKDPKMFWWPRTDSMKLGDGKLELESGHKKRVSCGFWLDISNKIVKKLSLSFKAELKGEGRGMCILSFRDAMGKWLNEKAVKIKKGKAENYSSLIQLPPNVATVRITFYIINGKETVLTVSDVCLSPEKRGIMIQDFPCEGISIQKSAPGIEFYDKKAAEIIRKCLYKATGCEINFKCLPQKPEKVKKGTIYIGKAALSAGAVSEKDFDALKPGGYVINIKDGIVGLAGKAPGGLVSGAYALIEEVLGITFLSNYVTVPALKKRDVLVFKENKCVKSPAFQFRFLRSSEKLGFTDENYIGDGRLIGCGASSGHTAPGLVEFDKYHKEHPEYFALGKDGKRLHKDPDSRRFDIHFCMSNKDVQKLIANQVLAWMDACPQGKYFWVTPGDGRGHYCRCESCKAMDEEQGNYTDRNIKFVNAIARIVAKKHPDNVILTFAYVDIEKPPVKTKPESNVTVLYCPYPLNWSNHLEAFDKEYNSEGMKTLNGWINYCPENLGIFCYPSCCGEMLNIWPAFYANYQKIRYYAKHNLKGIYFCGLRGQRHGYPGANSFNEMSRFVLGKVLWEPDLDVEKEINRFMKLYYGPAGNRMREFFNLIHQEVKDRHFVQHTEEVKRGFVTKELADKAYALFAKAEKAVKGKPEYLDRVLKEKLYLLFSDLSDRCRTNGKLSEKDLPAYAERLAEFARLSQKFNVNYFARRITPKEWLWNTALLRVKNPRWYNDKLIASLIEKPLYTIGSTLPRCQKKIDNGYSIPSVGIGGGQSLETYSYKCPRRDGLKILRRPSSGYGYMMTYLYLDEGLEKNMKLKLEGQDSDKPGKALMKVKVNGKVIFDGKVEFPKFNWGWTEISIPEGTLKKGKNLIEIENTTPDIVTEEEKNAVDFIVGRKKNYYWGWLIISGLEVVSKNNSEKDEVK